MKIPDSSEIEKIEKDVFLEFSTMYDTSDGGSEMAISFEEFKKALKEIQRQKMIHILKINNKQDVFNYDQKEFIHSMYFKLRKKSS